MTLAEILRADLARGDKISLAEARESVALRQAVAPMSGYEMAEVQAVLKRLALKETGRR